MVRRFALIIFLLVSLTVFAAPPDGHAQIRARAGNSDMVVTTTRRLAGAIDSLTWNGQEFVNSTDHGRQLQSACSFDDSPAANAETFNPTEAGSRDDGAGTNTTSRLRQIRAKGNRLHTRTQMAFWLKPGESSGGELARNTNALSDYMLAKDVRIGFDRWPQALDYRVTFKLPQSAHHASAQFEALTAYMPPEFSRFWEFNPRIGMLQALSADPGEINNPIVLATPDGRFAMGIFSPPQNQPGTTGPGYGRWTFPEASVVKWNCVFRVRRDKGLCGGDYSYRMLVPVGTLAQVETMLREWRDVNW